MVTIENLKKAIEQENSLKAEGNLSFNTINAVIRTLGFSRVPQYYEMKRNYLFNEWQPEFYYIKISDFIEKTNEAIKNGKYGVYIPVGEGVHAWHGDHIIDYNLCKDLGVKVYDLNCHGGTIIGSEKDFSIMIIAPTNIGLTDDFINDEIVKFISKYIPTTSWLGNDILIDGKKICGTCLRHLEKSTVWTGQFSFADYSEYIELICNKKSDKEPSYIDSNMLSKENLEKEFIAWLTNKNN